VKLAAFHLMPWPDLPDDFLSREPSAWVSYSNAAFDPGRGAALYERYLQELVHAEEVGFEILCVNEHHQTAYGLMPSPNLMAMALVQRTKRAQIAILGNAIPLREDPLRVIEEIAMLDVMSGGRIICGIVRGIGAEYHSFGVNPVHSEERFREAHDLMIAAWTRPGPFEWEGKHYQARYVNPWPRPLQKPHPPIWLPTQGSASTVRWAAEHRYPLFQTFSPIDTLATATQQFWAEADRLGYEATPSQLGWAVPVYVGANDESALADYKPHVEYLYHKLRHRPFGLVMPPGYVSRSSFRGVLARRAGVGRERPSAEELLERGEIIVGGPTAVREQLRRAIDATGIGNLAVMFQAGTLGQDATRASLERFAEHVMPALVDYEPERPPNAARAAEPSPAA
jgi:alkanesulfonate monooxygenase SsuD/methylene tetrahydromethanopterin reductase-like flavin-dependent oxidoreductase (luciferase family)